ncbi:MAG: YkgJ family cysteine cluster protein [Dehalococcoidales bacterium]|nr:YkgJ family cysteine cluster protein [Dehalococcoidales bacterium]
MADELRKRPRCSQCGECCRAPVVLITKTSDYKRWVEQGREDILKHATVPPLRGYGDLWIDIRGTEDSPYCPFIKKTSEGKYTCTIQDTKPEVCRGFFCEWAYGAGKKGVPFKTDRGWTDKAKNSATANPGKRKTNKYLPNYRPV